MAFTKITAAGIGTTESVTLDGLSVINNGSFGGNLTVGGVLTYEDVTNVDSVGLITARNGIVVGSGITLSKDGDIFATGISTFSGNVKVGTGITLSPDGDVFFTGIATGNGSGLTALNASNISSGTVPTARLGSGTASSSTFLRGDSTFAAVTSTTINSNADNRVITGSGTANTLNGESNLTFDGSTLGLTGSQTISGDLDIASDIRHIGDTNTKIKFAEADHISLETAGSERLRLNNQYLIKGHTSVYPIAGHYPSVQLTGTTFNDATLSLINNANDATGSYIYLSKQRSGSQGGATVVQDDDLVGQIGWTAGDGTDVTSRIAEIKGMIDGTPGSNDTPGRLSFWTTADGNQSATERLRISSNGTVYPIGNGQSFNSATLPNGHNVQINTTSSSHGFSVTRYSGSYAAYGLNIGRSKSDTIGTNSIVANGDDLGHITWYGADGSDFNQAATITAQVDGTPSNGTDMPGRILFKTSNDGSGTPTEKLRISSDGKLTVYVNDNNTSRVNATHITVQNSNFGASACAGIMLAASNGANSEFNIVAQKHSSGSGADFHLDNGTDAMIQISGDNGDIKFGVSGTMITSFTPGLGNTVTGIGMEPRNGSIFLSRSDGASLYLNTNTDGSHLARFNRNGSEQGKIIAHTSSVSYETTSDYRIKENAVAISDGITRLKQLKPYRFNFKSNSSETLDGFFAHEAQAVVPECASGTKDEVVVQAQVDSEVYKESELGNPIYQGIDQSKLVPLLTAALQESITKIETLEAEVAALKSS